MTLSSLEGIPRIIHQTWRSRHVPTDKGDPESWQKLNPSWQYRFWTDEDLLNLMKSEFPDLAAMFVEYPLAVQRADLARYCILKRYGGVYADIDTRCLAPLDPLAGDHRVVLCEEPDEHQEPARCRGINKLYFNGTMASPPGHPFWDSMIEHCALMFPRCHVDVLDTTGPVLMSAIVEQWPTKAQLALNSSNLFAGLTVHGERPEVPPSGPFGHLVLSEHLWQGSWYKIRKEPWLRRKVGRVRQWRHILRPQPRIRLAKAAAEVDLPLLNRPLRSGLDIPVISILIPVRNGEPFLETNFEQIHKLDYPKDKLHILYGVAKSADRTSEVIADLCRRHSSEFASLGTIDLERNGPNLARAKRWKAKYQRKRRAGLAKARNDLLAEALQHDSDWYLWLDADVIGLPPDLISKLLSARAKIVTPDCVLTEGGKSYDLNAFVEIGRPTRAEYYRHVRHGLFQPPEDYWYRRHLCDLRYLDKVPLTGVGGTALLVHADVHRAGVRFPEVTYRDMIETEAFGALARDLGQSPVGLPKVTVFHARS